MKNKTKQMNLLMSIAMLFLLWTPLRAETTPEQKEIIDFVARIPMIHQGRVKPLDTFAQVNLLAIYGKRSVGKVGASEWLLEVLLDPEKANTRQIFDIRNVKVAEALSMTTRKSHKYSFNEIWPGLSKSIDFLRTAFGKAKDERDLVESQMLELYSNASRYIELSNSMAFLQPVFSLENAELASAFGLKAGEKQSFYYFNGKKDVFSQFLTGMKAKSPEELDSNDLEIVRLAQALDKMRKEYIQTEFQIIPPKQDVTELPWQSPWSLLNGSPISAKNSALLDMWQEIFRAYSTSGNMDKTKTMNVIESQVNEESGFKPSRLKLEVWNNRAHLLYKSVAFYILSFILLISSWAIWRKPLEKLSFYGLLIGFAFHTAGIFLRMIIMARPPVSTLYESIIFVGFISVLSAIIYEIMKKSSLGTLTGVVLGTSLHFIGFSYAADGDTMGMLVAVLDSNFWLATHVVTISIGYGCAFVAGFVGHLYLFFKIFKPEQKDRLVTLAKNMKGTTLIALFFTLFGTILGGIWADQSWGRFWGWDPKENGALLIVLWLLVILHGRYSKLFKDNGFAFGLVVNNIIVALAWFGVNLLNVGLHSYGFTDSIATNLLIFCGAEFLFGIIGYFWARARSK